MKKIIVYLGLMILLMSTVQIPGIQIRRGSPAQDDVHFSVTAPSGQPSGTYHSTSNWIMAAEFGFL